MLDNAPNPALAEARRQIEICNACRYCEGYCAVFPAIARARSFSDGDLTQLANLCHNCRGCWERTTVAGKRLAWRTVQGRHSVTGWVRLWGSGSP